MRAVVRRPGPADRLTRSAHPDQRRQLQHRRLDHRCCSLSGETTLLGESFANNAESSPWILITDLAVANSASSLALSASNPAVRLTHTQRRPGSRRLTTPNLVDQHQILLLISPSRFTKPRRLGVSHYRLTERVEINGMLFFGSSAVVVPGGPMWATHRALYRFLAYRGSVTTEQGTVCARIKGMAECPRGPSGHGRRVRLRG